MAVFAFRTDDYAGALQTVGKNGSTAEATVVDLEVGGRRNAAENLLVSPLEVKAKYLKQKAVRVFRGLSGGIARCSPIKTNCFGYPNKIIEKADWLKPERSQDLPSYVSAVQFLPDREIRNVTPPKRIKETDPLLWQEHYRWKPRQRQVVTLKGARICRSLTIVAPDHLILWELSHLWNVQPAKHPLLRYPVLPAPRRLPGRTLFLSADMSDNYFHWMLDMLPKLTVLEEAGIDLQQFDHYLVCSWGKEFQIESLKRWNIPLEKVITTERPGYGHLETEILVVPSWADQSSYYADCDMKRMKNVLMPMSGNDKLPKRFFIDRLQNRSRNIANKEEFLAVMKKHGIASVELESLSFPDQAWLFDRAELVIGMHGAGLTNFLFSNSGTKVLELVNPNWPLWMYWNLAASRGLDYHYLVGKPVEFRRELFQEQDAEQRLQDLEIDIAAIDRALEGWK